MSLPALSPERRAEVREFVLRCERIAEAMSDLAGEDFPNLTYRRADHALGYDRLSNDLASCLGDAVSSARFATQALKWLARAACEAAGVERPPMLAWASLPIKPAIDPIADDAEFNSFADALAAEVSPALARLDEEAA